METKIATTIEQSKKLLELGIDPSTADMFYSYELRFGKISDNQIEEDGFVRAWSLSALMNLMPKGFILVKGSSDGKYYLYTKEYIPTGNCCVSGEAVIDAVFEMIIYLKEIKFI